MLEDIGEVKRLPAVAKKKSKTKNKAITFNSSAHSPKRKFHPMIVIYFSSSYPN